jgi:D-alanyl-D-alanine carboxypeptidase
MRDNRLSRSRPVFVSPEQADLERRIAKDRNRIVPLLRTSHLFSPLRGLLRKAALNGMVLAAALAFAAPRVACATEAHLLIEADTGKVLEAENATIPWYPASLTKIMTAYVTLKAVKDGKITLDTLFTVSPTAASQSPSKMGFKPGTRVTVDNALKMMLVKSANDMAVVLAEGVGGSIDGFSAMMNDTAQKLGMTQTSYVNPNGLPADGQITSARDLGILSRSFLRNLPEYEYYVHIPAIRFGKRVTQNFNKLIGRYPGADGFKTGFICASGYNLVGSATHNGRRLIAVVLGASSGQMRAVRAAQLLERGFAQNSLGWLKPSLGTVENLAPVDTSPPNLRDDMCGGHRHKPASDEDEVASNGTAGSTGTGDTNPMFYTAGLQPPVANPVALIAGAPEPNEPVVVYTGPTRTGAALIAAVAADTASQDTPKAKGKKARLAAKKPDAAAEPKSDAKSEPKAATKPAAAKQANAKPNAAAKSADKPAATASDATTAKPAKPKPVAAKKPKPATGDGKPAASDAKPSG